LQQFEYFAMIFN